MTADLLKEMKELRLAGLPGGGLAWWLWRNRGALPRALLLTATDEDAQALADNLEALARWQAPGAPSPVAYFPEDEPDQRMSALSRWGLGAAAETPAQFLTSSWENARAALPSPAEFKESHRRLRRGDAADRAELMAHLSRVGYARVDTVEQVGEMAVRGEVMDLWSPGWEEPVRALWPYDRVESLRKINLATQRSTDLLDEVLLRPVKLKDAVTLYYHLGEDGAVMLSKLPGTADVPWPGRRVVHTELDTADRASDECRGGAADRREGLEPVPPFPNPAGVGAQNLFLAQLQKWLKDGWRAVIFCHNVGEQERLEEILMEGDRSLGDALDSGALSFPLGDLVEGFLDPAAKLALLSNGQVFGRTRRRLRLPKFAGGKALSEITELGKGDFVVHERFGVGRYRGLDRVDTGGAEGDYLKLEYKGGDRVLVPLFEFRQVQKFVGTGGKAPKLSSLDTATWERTKEQVKESVAELARELLARAAKRAAAQGTLFPPDNHMEKEFGDAFYYNLTPDQAKAIEEVKADMMQPRPMDRLVCGDVGYGKTEVALRAAFKAVTAGKQVGILVPTTILAEQHGRTFRDRFADFPVSIAVLSRFATPAEEKRILADLRRGVLDVVIGTHRLLSPDVTFKDLGLLIVDEEHRFGVKQKDRLMAFRDVVDVLALSATPIPRTLGAALGGVKALSVIESPPEGRLPIATHVGPLDEKIVVAGIEHELQRGGQVFYVHNRVGTIAGRKKWLEDVLKARGLKADIAFAHGKMTGPQLERIMWDFLHKKHNILLSTSIIESGLDIPTVNTLIVEEAEDFGLSQLYQLRGRVGRERLKAYCYLFYSPGTGLTEEARKRLSALNEFASLGSGFKLALRDLEIRGAGNLLGPQQHGFVNAVGIDLYGQLLTEEIRKQKGEAGPERPREELALEIPVSAFLPETYVPSEAERISLYKRLLDSPPKELEALREELIDRCGKLPAPAAKLFEVARLRWLAREKKVIKVALARQGLEIRFDPRAVFASETLERLMKTHDGSLHFLPGPLQGVRLDPAPEDPVAGAINFLRSLG